MENLVNKLKRIEPETECIILIHGLARSSRCMNKAAAILASYGYAINNISYPSRKKTIKELVKQHILSEIKSVEANNYKQIHFLTHSMGGILLRSYLSEHEIKNLAKSVMLAAPNQGSEVVDKLGHLSLFSVLNGPAGKQLGTDLNSVPRQLGHIDFEAGVIAGDQTINPLLSLLIPGKNDGKVSVKRTQVEGMKDFLLVPHSHAFIMQKTRVIYQVLFFIQNGCFYK